MPWPTVSVVTTGMDADTDALPRAAILDLTTKFNQLIAMRGVASGVCDLDASALVPITRIPSTIQRQGTKLDNLKAMNTTVGLVEQTGADTFTKTPITAFAKTLLDDTTAAAARTTLGVVSAASASETVAGIMKLSTPDEVAYGMVDNEAVSPAGLRAGLNASGSAPVYACRAWVNFNGTLAAASMIQASGNVSSITDNGAGDYTINFTTAMQDANYAVVGTTSYNSNDTLEGGVVINTLSGVAPTTAGVRMRVKPGNNATAIDVPRASVSIFR